VLEFLPIAIPEFVAALLPIAIAPLFVGTAAPCPTSTSDDTLLVEENVIVS
jgi:hypothetical protein